MSDLVKRLVRLSEDGRGWEKARGLLAEAASEIARLNELLRGTGANRYWEGRWRDEKAENDRLRATLAAARPVGTDAQVEAAAKALCDNWPKDPNGCAALCMDRIGSIPKEGCRHRVAVHGKRARAALAAAQAGANAPKWDDVGRAHNIGFAAGIEAAAKWHDERAATPKFCMDPTEDHEYAAKAIRALRPAAPTESEVMQHYTGNRQHRPSDKTPPLSASEPAGAQWVKSMLLEWTAVNGDPNGFELDDLAKTIAAKFEPAGANPCARILDFPWLDPECVANGCQSLLLQAKAGAFTPD